MKIPKIFKGQTELTQAQKEYLAVFAQEQIKRYLSCEQFVSDKTIKLYVNNAYKVAGLPFPKKIQWFDSPEKSVKHWASVWASVGDSVRASVWDSVRASVWASVGDSVRASVWASVGDSVRASVRASVWASVGDSV